MFLLSFVCDHAFFTEFVFFYSLYLVTVWLNGTWTGNETEKFVGFMIYVDNEFEDEESGHFVTPLPQGVSMTECHLDARSQYMHKVRHKRCNFSVLS